MKFLINLLFFGFLFYLSAPTLVSLLDKEEDITYFYNFAEEEVENEVTAEDAKLKHEALLFDISFYFVSKPYELKLINSTILGYKNLAHQIFSPPPNNLKYFS
jgi:hypothetical protein